jgi:hypothetical protein
MHPPVTPGELGLRSMCYRHFSRQRKRVELPFEVTPLDVTTPLTLVLDGGATIFSRAATLEFGPQICCSETCRSRCH